MCLLAFLRGNGTVFPRRRLQLFFLRRKRYPIPAQKGATGCYGRIWRLISARNFICGQSARVMRSIPAQAATFFCSMRIWQRIPAQNFIRGQSARVRRAIPAQVATFSVPGVFGGSFPRGQQKKLTQKVSFAVYFLKYVLLLNLLVIADQNLHQKSFSHQNPLYIPFLLLGICP